MAASARAANESTHTSSLSDVEKQDVAHLGQASPDLTNSGQQSFEAPLDFTAEEEACVVRKSALRVLLICRTATDGHRSQLIGTSYPA